MKNSLRKQKEKFIAVTGTGWPSHAKRSHPQHHEYARKTLYAYMPCYDLRGTDYIDEVVHTHYGDSYTEALRDFATDAYNLWCPRWIQRNYQVQNKDSIDPTVPPDPPDRTASAKPPEPSGPKENAKSREAKDPFPHAGRFPITFTFPPEGEPNGEEDPERAEEHGTDYNWRRENRPPWQMHSEWGPNPDAESSGKGAVPLPFEDLVNPTAPRLPYDRHWGNYNASRTEQTWTRLKGESNVYDDETLRAATFGDDYQQLFVTMVLDHVQHVIESVRNGEQPEPLRLLLLGTAGSGKTRATQTMLQELRRALAAADLPTEIEPSSFVIMY